MAAAPSQTPPLVQHGIDAAAAAVRADTSGDLSVAIPRYLEAVDVFERAEALPTHVLSDSDKQLLLERARGYAERVAALRAALQLPAQQLSGLSDAVPVAPGAGGGGCAAPPVVAAVAVADDTSYYAAAEPASEPTAARAASSSRRVFYVAQTDVLAAKCVQRAWRSCAARRALAALRRAARNTPVVRATARPGRGGSVVHKVRGGAWSRGRRRVRCGLLAPGGLCLPSNTARRDHVTTVPNARRPRKVVASRLATRDDLLSLFLSPLPSLALSRSGTERSSSSSARPLVRTFRARARRQAAVTRRPCSASGPPSGALGAQRRSEPPPAAAAVPFARSRAIWSSTPEAIATAGFSIGRRRPVIGERNHEETTACACDTRASRLDRSRGRVREAPSLVGHLIGLPEKVY